MRTSILLATGLLLIVAMVSAGQNPNVSIFLEFEGGGNYLEPAVNDTFTAYVCLENFGAGGGTRGLSFRLNRTFGGTLVSKTNLLGGIEIGDPEGTGWDITASSCVYPDTVDVVVAAELQYTYGGTPGVLELFASVMSDRNVVDCDFAADQWCVRLEPSGHCGVHAAPPDGDCPAPPGILSTNPSQNQLDVSVTTDIAVNFDTDMDSASINDTTFLVHSGSTGLQAGIITYDDGSNTATFDPAVDLEVGETVVVSLTTGIRSSAGLSLEEPHVWSFNVEAGAGPGTFGPDSSYYAGSSLWGIIAADLNADGDPDLASTGFSGAVYVSINNGDGTFAYRVPYWVGTNPHSVFSSDLDNDGDLDIATSNDGSNDVSVLLNEGDGTFADDYTCSVAGSPKSVFGGDLDGDGDVDLVTAGPDWVSVRLNDGSGFFFQPPFPYADYLVTDYPITGFAGDLDGDGDLDIATGNLGSDNVAVLVNNGDGTFVSPPVYLAVGDQPYTVIGADLDDDGDMDLATVNYASDDVSILFNGGNGSFAPNTTYPAGNTPRYLTACDVDGDGDIDLAAANMFDETVSILLNDGLGAFVLSSSGGTGGKHPVAVCSGDLDGDGDMDLATANYLSSYVSVLLNVAPPEVISTSPGLNELGVSRFGDISVAFNVDMAETTLNDTTLLVHTGSGGLRTGSLTYDAPTKTATFNPDFDFEAGDIVTVTLTQGVESAHDLPLTECYVWSFTVAASDGHGAFSRSSTYGLGSYTSSSSVADLDGDGVLDLAAANYGFNEIKVLLGNGDGTFATGGVYGVGFNPGSILSADLDNDGDVDLAVANEGGDMFNADSTVSVLLNNGNGTFAAHVEYLAGLRPRSISGADLDGDGDIDLVTANSGDMTHPDSSVSVILNNGDGSFAGAARYLAGTSVPAVCAGDLDGDGDIDLAAAGYGNWGHIILKNAGDGTFLVDSTYHLPGYTEVIRAADLDGDGDLDLVSSNAYDAVWIYDNNGNGVFSPDSAYVVDNPQDVMAADLDGDGDLDLAVPQDIVNDRVVVLLNDGAGEFGDADLFYAGVDPVAVSGGDLDGDGDIDLVTAHYEPGYVSVLQNISKPHVRYVVPAMNEMRAPDTTTVAVTFDVRMDETTIDDSLFVAHAASGGLCAGTLTYDDPTKTMTFDPLEDLPAGEVVAVTLMAGMESAKGVPVENGLVWSFRTAAEEGDARFEAPASYPAGNGTFSVCAVDADLDGDTDLAAVSTISDDMTILVNDGTGIFSPDSVYQVGKTPYCVIAVDVDMDGYPDMVTANASADSIAVLLNQSGSAFAAPAMYAVGDLPSEVIAVDLDTDGDMDLVAANTASDGVTVMLNGGDGTFVADSTYSHGNEPSCICWGDLDSDGDMDLATASRWADNVTILVNQGDGTFAAGSTCVVGDSPISICAADFDRDGDLDLVTANSVSDNISLLLGDGDGSFAPQMTYATGDKPYSVIAVDLDGDVFIDLATANRDADQISGHRNVGAIGELFLGFSSPMSFSAGDEPIVVCAADLDGDGDMDLVTANYTSDDVTVLLNKNLSGVEEPEPALPERFALSPNRPNPFVAVTEIRYALPKACRVRLDVFNTLGQKVADLIDRVEEPGYGSIHWDSGTLPSGVYFIRLQAGGRVATRKTVLVR